MRCMDNGQVSITRVESTRQERGEGKVTHEEHTQNKKNENTHVMRGVEISRVCKIINEYD